MASTGYNVENLTATKTVELRKLAGSIGIKGMSSARKGDLIPAILAILAEQETERREGVREALDQAAAEGWNGSLKPTKADKRYTAKTARAQLKAERTADGTGLSSERPTEEISAKALRFEADAKAAGWSAMARNGFDGTSLVTATAKDGRTLELHWVGKVYVYDKSKYVASGATKGRKIRNASAARKILAES